MVGTPEQETLLSHTIPQILLAQVSNTGLKAKKRHQVTCNHDRIYDSIKVSRFFIKCERIKAAGCNFNEPVGKLLPSKKKKKKKDKKVT